MERFLDKITLGDSYDLIKQLPNKSVDLIVTDPPYELETRGGGFHNKRDYYDKLHDEGLSNGIDECLLKEFIRVMKSTNIYLFCNKNQLRQYFEFFKDFNCDLLVWHKVNPIPTVNNRYLSDLEYIFFAREKGVKIYGNYETLSKVYTSQINKKDKQLFEHLTPKPLPLIKKLVENSSKENDIVLDCFMGSGTTAVACKETRRHFVGFEIEPKWHKVANDRINGITACGQMSFLLR